MEATLFSFVRALQPIIGNAIVAGLIIAMFAVALVSGAVLQFRQHGIRPADWYVIANLVLLLGDLFQPERYFLPIAPFLIGYVIVFAQALAHRLSRQQAKRLIAGFIGAWVALLTVLDGYLLFVGNADGSRGGMSRLASPDIETYYQSHHRDLYRAIRYVDGVAPANVKIGADGFHGKYLLALGGRSFENHPYGDMRSVDWLVQRTDNQSAESLPPEWRLVREFESHRVYHREP